MFSTRLVSDCNLLSRFTLTSLRSNTRAGNYLVTANRSATNPSSRDVTLEDFRNVVDHLSSCTRHDIDYSNQDTGATPSSLVPADIPLKLYRLTMNPMQPEMRQYWAPRAKKVMGVRVICMLTLQPFSLVAIISQLAEK